MGIKHLYVDPVPDAGNPGGRVDSDDWNADHVIDGVLDMGGFDLLVDDGTGIGSTEAGNPALLLFESVASAVNYLTITNADTGNSPRITATGTDADIGFGFRSKGDSEISFGNETAATDVIVRLNSDNSQLSLLALDAGPTVIDFDATSFEISHTSERMLLFNPVASAVNYLTVTNAATGSAPIIDAVGTDTDIELWFRAKAANGEASAFRFVSNNALADNTTLRVYEPANSDFFEATARAGEVIFAARQDVTFNINVGGNQAITFGHSEGDNKTLELLGAASAVNYISISNEATGEKPVIAAVGTDTNIGIEFLAKGDGTFLFSGEGADNEILGAFQIWATSSSAGAQNGFGAAIEFKLENDTGSDAFDAGKLAVYTHDVAAELGTLLVSLADGAGDVVTGLEVVGVASAVNYLTITNAVTGGMPSIAPTGDLAGLTFGASFLSLTEMSAPAAGAANTLRLFARDNGGGKTQLCAIANGGAAEVIWTQA
jgi:hypothetical protein